MRPVPGAARGAADRAVRRRARRSAARFATTSAGTVRQGALSPTQALTLRPHPSCADTRTPVPGFYLGGGGVHPGVPGLLGAGMLAARAVMADRGLGARV